MAKIVAKTKKPHTISKTIILPAGTAVVSKMPGPQVALRTRRSKSGGVAGVLIGWKAGNTLDRPPVQHKADTQTYTFTHT